MAALSQLCDYKDKQRINLKALCTCPAILIFTFSAAFIVSYMIESTLYYKTGFALDDVANWGLR